MATRKLKLTGPVKWAKVFEVNRDMHGFGGAYEDHEGGYTINIGLDAKNFEKLSESGSMKKGKMEEDGLTWVKFLRKHKDRFEWSSGAPEVFNGDDPWVLDEMGLIGNGSTAELTLSVYDTAYSGVVGTRLDTVKVTDVVPFERPEPADSEGIPF